MPFAELASSRVPIAASSDSPCAFSAPLLTSARGVTRLTSKDTVLELSQSLPYETWLYAYTSGAAYAGGQEHERGRLAPGLQADLVVLDGPLDAEHPPRVADLGRRQAGVPFVRPRGVGGPERRRREQRALRCARSAVRRATCLQNKVVRAPSHGVGKCDVVM